MGVKCYGWAVVIPLALAARAPADEEGAALALDGLGGRITRDEEFPTTPVIEVDLAGTRLTDPWMKVFRDLPHLRTLTLEGTRITDAGLKELKDLRDLRTLNISRTRVTDLGLKELKSLKDLHTLDLAVTDVTDAGLKDLRDFKDLRSLRLDGTRVTDAGVTALQAALPRCKIIR